MFSRWLQTNGGRLWQQIRRNELCFKARALLVMEGRRGTKMVANTAALCQNRGP